MGDERGMALGFIFVEGELARSRDGCGRSTARIPRLVAMARSTHSVEGRTDEAVPHDRDCEARDDSETQRLALRARPTVTHKATDIATPGVGAVGV